MTIFNAVDEYISDLFNLKKTSVKQTNKKSYFFNIAKIRLLTIKKNHVQKKIKPSFQMHTVRGEVGPGHILGILLRHYTEIDFNRIGPNFRGGVIGGY